MKCIVLGAGIAGLVAALELQKHGCQVTVIEAAPIAGGRASSWRTSSGLETGSGLHVVADHYTNLLDVLASIDALGEIVWWNKHSYLRPGEIPVVWRYNHLPAPFHLLNPAIGMPLVLSSKLRLFRASLDATRYRQEDLHLLDDISYLDWHNRHRLGEGFILDLAALAADAATFLPLHKAAARPVLSWLKYMSRTCRAGRIGTWRRPLSEGLIAPLVAAIKKFGGTVRTGTEAVNVWIEGKRVRGVRVCISGWESPNRPARNDSSDREQLHTLACDSLISAVPVQALRILLDQNTVESSGLAQPLSLSTVPAISVVVRFDRKIHPSPVGVPLVTGCMIRDLIDLSELRGETPNSVVQFLVSHSAKWMAETDESVISAVSRDFSALWPAAAEAKIADAVVERIGHAMFAAHPGSHRLRPSTATKIPNFFIAGDWVRHDLNASMEGAALSGRLAARAVLLQEHRDGVPVLRPDESLTNRAIQFLARPSSVVGRTADEH